MKLRYISLIIVLISFTTISAQNFVSDVSKKGTTAAQFLHVSQGARASGMGSAFVALADDASAIYWNVAGIARLKSNEATFDHTQWIKDADINYNFLASTFNLGSFGTIGVSFISSDYGDMKVTTIDEPNGTGETFTISDIAFSVAWAYNITDNFSIGFNPKFIYQSIWKMSDWAMAIDMGVLYDTPFDGITLGMSITNFGPKMQLEGKSSIVLHDLDEESSGNNEKIPANLSTDDWDLPLGFKVGIAYEALSTDYHDLRFALDALHPNDNYESVNVGGEYVFNNMFAIRAGYKSLFLEDSEEGLTLGAGFRKYLMGNVSIVADYSYADFGRLGDVQKFSIGVTF